MNNLSVLIKSSFLDRQRMLHLTPDYIEFDDMDLKDALPSRIETQDITGLKYCIEPIYGLKFSIGRVYMIDIQNADKQVLKIRFRSLYGIKKRELNKQFDDILDYLVNNYIKGMLDKCLADFDNGNDIQLCDIIIRTDAVQLNKRNQPVEWQDIAIRTYHARISVYSKTQPENHCVIDYSNHWNVDLLYSVIKNVLARKGLS